MEPSTARAAARVDCGQCAALRGEECAYTSGPAGPVRGYHAGRLALAGSPVPGLLSAAIVWDNGDAPRLPDEDAGNAEIHAMAAALLSGKIIALRKYVGRANAGAARPPPHARVCSRPLTSYMHGQGMSC
jgi:hypothetical protein